MPLSWKAPYRPTENQVTQCFDDGIVTIYAIADGGEPGYRPVPQPTKKITLRYEEQRLGIQRYYEGRQNQVEIQRVIRTPRAGHVSNQDIAVTEDGRQYRVDLVQSVENVWPACQDITLAKIQQQYDVSNLDTGEVET